MTCWVKLGSNFVLVSAVPLLPVALVEAMMMLVFGGVGTRTVDCMFRLQIRLENEELEYLFKLRCEREGRLLTFNYEL